MARSIAKTIIEGIFKLRVPGNPIHRMLAWEYQLRNLAFDELRRILYYQPMFESRCAKVGKNVRLELCPDSKLPPIFNADVELGDRVRLSARITFSGARNAEKRPRIVVGDDSYIGHRVALRAGTEIIIGKHVLIASNAVLSGDPGHPMDAEERRTQAAPRASLGRIVIGDDAWLAYNVNVVGNVTIGEGAIVAAGSVVTKDVPAYSVVAGNPARVVRMLKEDKIRIPQESAPHENALRIDRNTAREEVERRYIDLFMSENGTPPTQAQRDAIVQRAVDELTSQAAQPKKQAPTVNAVVPSSTDDVTQP